MKKTVLAVGYAYICLLVFILIALDQLICKFMPIPNPHVGGPELVFVAFIAWAMYFFSGGTLKGGVKAAIGYVVGISFSIAIILLAGVFGASFYAVPLAAAIVVFPVLYLEKVPWFDLLAAHFAAAGCFFGMTAYLPGATLWNCAGVELVYGLIGLTFGWITIEGRTVITNYLQKKFEKK